MMIEKYRRLRVTRRISHLGVAGLLLGLAACGAQNAAPESITDGRALRFPAEGSVAITVNGEKLSESLLAGMAQTRGLDISDPAQREQAMNLLVETVLLSQDAIDTGLAERKDVQTALDLARIQTLAARNLADARAGMDMTDEQLREFYKQVLAQTGTLEMQLRNVLFPDEKSAQAGAKAALASSDFVEWMKTAESQGAHQVRELGWANVAQLPPELARVALEMKDGEVSPEPVRSRFGWHVFQRVASRDFAPPPFEEVRDGIRKQAGDKYLEEKLAALRAAASIEPTPVTQ